MKFKLGQKIYDITDLDLVTLKDILLLEKQTTDFGHPLRWTEVLSMAEELEAIETDRERGAHPDALWVTAVTIWAARRAAGDDVTWDQAIDFPMRDLQFLPDTQDHKVATSPKARARKGSGQAAKRRLADEVGPTRTSELVSTSD